MRAVSQNCSGQVEQASAFETFDKSAAEIFARDLLIDRVLGRVDMDANAQPLRQLNTVNECLFLKREAGMGADHCGEPPARSHYTCFRIPLVLIESRAAFAGPVAVGHFVTQHAAT